MTTQVFVASTAFGLATVVAALDDGAFAPVARRVLLLSHNAAVPETAPRVDDVAGAEALTAHFDVVYDYNEAIAPQHPSLWRPRAVDLPLLERHLSALWSITDDVHLVVESIQVSPALTLCRIFADARIDVYADGLMSYGPTRSKLPAAVASRIERLWHLDLVPGLSPVLLTEHGVPARLISTDAFRKAIDALAPPPDIVRHGAPGEIAVLLGQYLAAAGILTDQEESDLHLEMVRGAVAAGYRRLVFKPHPSAPGRSTDPLVEAAARSGATLTVNDSPELVETWFRSESVGCVIGCFSTALATARALYDVPAARVGTELLLERLRPYENSNRIPVTLVDATVRPVTELVGPDQTSAQASRSPWFSPASEVVGVQTLVDAVSYCMQPQLYPGLRPTALVVTSRMALSAGGAGPSGARHYFKRRRLALLGLPGGPEVRTRSLVHVRVRRVAHKLLGPGATARVAKLVRH